MRFYRAVSDLAAGYTSDLRATPRWELPWVRDCPGCGGTWGDDACRYPCVDLSMLPEHPDYENPEPQPYDVYVRMRERIRPLLPPWAVLRPGASIGPMVGRATGTFSPLSMQNPWSFYMRREALEQLQQAGLRGLQGCPMQVRFRGKNPPEMVEPQLEMHGESHVDCVPADRRPPCDKCGSKGYRLPDPYLLDATTLPRHLDIFRLAGWSSLILVTERFVDEVKRLGLDGVVFREAAVR